MSNTKRSDAITEAVRGAADELASIPGLIGGEPHVYVPRIAFELRLLVERKGSAFTLWDLGGGNGMLCLAAARLGVQATNVDDLVGLMPTGADVRVAELLTARDVRMIRHDLTEPVPIDQGVDVVTTMHTIEHMHTSPKAQYRLVADALAPGGMFVIASPNAVNLRKRVSAIAGAASWSPISEWYETPVFRGHVREPRVADLAYIANDLRLDATIIGKNFMARTRGGWRGGAARLLGPALERRPALCSDLYLIATRRP